MQSAALVIFSPLESPEVMGERGREVIEVGWGGEEGDI